MSNIVKTADFHGHTIPVILKNGEPWMNAEDIGSALCYDIPRKAIHEIFRRHRDELEEHTCVLSLRQADDSQRRECRLYNEEGVMIITMLSRQPRAAEFRRWAVKVLKSYRKGDIAPASGDHLGLAAEIGRLRDENAGLKAELLDLMRFKVTALEKSKLPIRRNLTDAECAEINRLVRSGMTKAEVGRRVGRSKTAIDIAMRRTTTGGAI